MPTIAERLKKLESINDADLMMGYRFLVAPRRKRSGAKRMAKKASCGKRKISDSSQGIVRKSAGKTG
jgi:hypothetical protein